MKGKLSGFPSPGGGAAPGPCTQEKGRVVARGQNPRHHPPRPREDQPASGSGRKSAGGSTPSRAARAYQWALDRGVRTCVS
ncbi:hypothetical protein GA0115236_153315 [Streptomyces sp. IgraMP-1]|nr:hypothetical protein GA0115236_153315 [Streptomyces sp. IgraMP-1]